GWVAGLEIAPALLLPLDGLEQGLEVALAEAARAAALDDLEEQRRAVLDGLGEDLQQVALVVAVDHDVEALDLLDVLADGADAVPQVGVVGLRHGEKLHAAAPQRVDRGADVAGDQRDVLHAGGAVEVEVFLDLRLAL